MANYQSAYTGAQIDTAIERINSISDAAISKLTNLLDTIYPIGSIYMSVNPTNPETFIGGQWARITDVFLLASGSTYSPGTTGGAATVTLTSNQMPKHGHQVYVWDATGTQANAYYYNATGGTTTHNGARVYKSDSSSWYASGTTANAAGSGRGDPSGSAGISGGGAAHDNMPPYLAVYVWQRTA